LCVQGSSIPAETAEVLRRHEAFQERKLELGRAKVSENQGNLDAVLRVCAIESWGPEVASALEETTEERALDALTAAHQAMGSSLSSSDDGPSPAQIMLFVAKGCVRGASRWKDPAGGKC
jgi:hypothetical protein